MKNCAIVMLEMKQGWCVACHIQSVSPALMCILVPIKKILDSYLLRITKILENKSCKGHSTSHHPCHHLMVKLVARSVRLGEERYN